MSVFVSFAMLPGPNDMMSVDGAAATAIVSTGRAAMVSSECHGGDLLAIGIQQDVLVDVVLFQWSYVDSKLRGVTQMINSG